MDQETEVRLRYQPQLDGLRAVAVVLVILHHALLPEWFGGWLGIDVFFVLSGYLITALLQVERRRTGSIHFGRFYLRRLLRLYPPLLVAVAVLLPLGFAFWDSSVKYFASSVLALTYTTNLATMVLGTATGPWTHTWTLAMEEQFYLLWPLVLAAATAVRMPRRLLVWLLVVLGVGSMVAGAMFYAPGSVSSFNPFLHVGPLLLGCVLGLTSAWMRAASSAFIAGVAVALLAVGIVGGSVEATAGMFELPVVAGSLLLVAHLVSAPQSPVSRLLALRPLAWTGVVSYELYLWHYPLLLLLGNVVSDRFLVVGLAVGASFLFAAASRRFVSDPLNRRFKARLAHMSPAAAPVRPRLPQPGGDTRLVE